MRSSASFQRKLMTDNPNLNPRRQPDDADVALRPGTLAGFVGQAAAQKQYGLAAALSASMVLP